MRLPGKENAAGFLGVSKIVVPTPQVPQLGSTSRLNKSLVIGVGSASCRKPPALGRGGPAGKTLAPVLFTLESRVRSL